MAFLSDSRRRAASSNLPAGLSAAVVVAAVALSFAAHRWDRLPGDLALARWMQDAPPPSGPAADAIRAVTSTEVVVVIGYSIAAGLVLAGARLRPLSLALLFLALPAAQAGVKNAVDRPRPSPALLDARGSATSESFPAGHVMSGTVLLVVLALLAWWLPAPRWVRFAVVAVLGVLALLNGAANVYEGVHWPSDVLGGYLWAGVLLAAWWWSRQLTPAALHLIGRRRDTPTS